MYRALALESHSFSVLREEWANSSPSMCLPSSLRSNWVCSLQFSVFGCWLGLIEIALNCQHHCCCWWWCDSINKISMAQSTSVMLWILAFRGKFWVSLYNFFEPFSLARGRFLPPLLLIFLKTDSMPAPGSEPQAVVAYSRHLVSFCFKVSKVNHL